QRLPAAIQTLLIREDSVQPFSSEPVPCFGSGYDLNEVRRKAAETGLPFVPWSTLASAVGKNLSHKPYPELQQLWTDLVSQDFFWDPCRIEGVELQEIAEPRLKEWWDRRVIPMWSAFQSARSILP